MKTFWPTLAAILVAATLIASVAGIGSCYNRSLQIDAETAMIKKKTEELKRTEDMVNEMRRMYDTTAPPPTPAPTASPVSAIENTISVIRESLELFAPPEPSPSP